METPLPPEYREKIAEAAEGLDDLTELMHVAGASLIEMLAQCFRVRSQRSTASKKLNDIQTEACTALGLDINDVNDFDMEKNVVRHVKRAKPN